jgi:hypothetical protein
MAMSSFGVLTTGFSQKDLQDILDEIVTDERSKFGPDINTSATSVLGQINGIFADQIHQLWQVAAAVYRSQYPDSASGDALNNVAAITGVLREQASRSRAQLVLNLDPGTSVPAGSVVSVGSTGARFQTIAIATNSLGYQANVPVTADSEDFGPIIGNAETIDTIQSAISGWSSGPAIDSGNAETFALSDGQTLTVKADGGITQTATFNTGDFADINNATAAEVAAVVDIDITGVTTHDAGGKVRIETDAQGTGSSIQVTGGTANAALGFATTELAGMNAADAVLGANVESDADFRLRRVEELGATGTSTVEAIRAAVLRVEDIQEAIVFENVTLVTDGDGIPGKAFEVVLFDSSLAVDADIAETIFLSKAAGILAHGTEGPFLVTDSQGFTHSIDFTRATENDIIVAITVAINGTYGGDDALKSAIAAEGNLQVIGQDVSYEQIKSAAFNVNGVRDVTVFTLDGGTSNIIINKREIATFDTSDITVTTVPWVDS